MALHGWQAWSKYTSCSLWGGTANSGSGFHYHNAAVNVLFFGKKRWFITPPRYAGISDIEALEWPDRTSAEALPQGLPYRYTQLAGDIVILPSQWGEPITAEGVHLGGLDYLQPIRCRAPSWQVTRL